MKRFILIAASVLLAYASARAQSGTIQCGETKMQYSVSGGKLTRGQDTERQRGLDHNYTGVINVGETISISFAGIAGIDGDCAPEASMFINPVGTGKRFDGHQKDFTPPAHEGFPSGHMSYTVEPGVEKIDVCMSFTTSAWNPMMGCVPFTTNVWVRYTVPQQQKSSSGSGKSSSSGSSLPRWEDPAGTDDGSGGENSGNNVHDEDNWANVLQDVTPYAIPAAVIAAITGIGIAAGKKKGGKKNQKNNNKPGPGTSPNTNTNSNQDDDSPTYSMHVYKDFGDTLNPGEPPQTVYARIVKTVKGQDMPDALLTSQIKIFSGQYLRVQPSGMQNGWQTAKVEAPEEEPIPDEGIVVFQLSGGSGSYTNRLHFVISHGEIVIDENGLTFPAGKGYERSLGFGINGISSPPSDINVMLSSAAQSKFSTRLEQDPENPLHFWIYVKETCPDKEDAGKVESYNCSVEVKLQSGKMLPPAHFTLFRMHLGLDMQLDALKAYIVGYNSSYDNEEFPTEPGCKRKFAQSRANFKLIVEDKETGQLRNVIPDEDPVFTFEDVPSEFMFADKYGNIVSEPCKFMKFKYEFQDVIELNNQLKEKEWYGLIHPTYGFLLPPNRGKAKVTASVTYQGETYTDTVEVPIISQPYRRNLDLAEYERLVTEDKEKLRQLYLMKHKISSDKRFAELMPYYYKVVAMTDGYKEEFGIYEPDYQRLIHVYNNYCSGKMPSSYFINSTVWTPEWSNDPSIFDAMVSTYGPMDKTWTGIFARIAIGVVTAGASELVFTPASALVKMKDYVNKGGDSAWEAFSTISKDILFWEGVFYLAGKGLKYAQEKGAGEYLGKKCGQLKDWYTKWKTGKDVGKNLASKPGFTTKTLGDQVKAAGEKTAATAQSARQNANKAIEDTIKSGYQGKNSAWAEAYSKRAREDGQKIYDNFKKVMNNPTATEEEIRRATLALQGNKAAQGILKESKSDLLRAGFNSNMKKYYSEVDAIAKKELASRLGVEPKYVRTWDGATSNAGDDLYRGYKIGADRDVTYQVFKDGKWVDIDEHLATKVYADSFNQYHYKFIPADQKEALKTLDKLDQSVVNGATSAESYGGDIGRIVDPMRNTEKLADPELVANTFKYKCNLWMNRGKEAIEQAEHLRSYGLVDEALSVGGNGMKLIEEGVRQNVKEFKRILMPRIQALQQAGKLPPKDYTRLLEEVNILEGLGTPPPKDAVSCTLEQARLTLDLKYGTTLEKVVEECASAIQEINPYLS